jgi:hypothetical protein
VTHLTRVFGASRPSASLPPRLRLAVKAVPPHFGQASTPELRSPTLLSFAPASDGAEVAPATRPPPRSGEPQFGHDFPTGTFHRQFGQTRSPDPAMRWILMATLAQVTLTCGSESGPGNTRRDDQSSDHALLAASVGDQAMARLRPKGVVWTVWGLACG